MTKRKVLIAIQIISAFFIVMYLMNFLNTDRESMLEIGHTKEDYKISQNYMNSIRNDGEELGKLLWGYEIENEKNQYININNLGDFDYNEDYETIYYKKSDLNNFLSNKQDDYLTDYQVDDFIKETKMYNPERSWKKYCIYNQIEKDELIELVEVSMENYIEYRYLYNNRNRILSNLDSNLTYIIFNTENNKITKSNFSKEDQAQLNKLLEKDKNTEKALISAKEKIYGPVVFQADHNSIKMPNNYKMVVGMKKDFIGSINNSKVSKASNSKYYNGYRSYALATKYRKNILGGLGVSSAVMIVTLILLLFNVLKGNDKLNAFDKLKTELGAAIIILPVFILMAFDFNFQTDLFLNDVIKPKEINNFNMGFWVFKEPVVFQITVALMVLNLILLVGYVSLIKRIRERQLWTNSILYLIYDGTKKSITNIRVLNKPSKHLAAIIILAAVLNFAAGCIAPIGVLFALIIDVIIIGKYAKNMKEYDDIQEGIEIISKGDINYKFNCSEFNGAAKATAESVNNISNGLEIAVEERLKSEKMQSELITNVGHDIKTPLTSIIGYIDLIKKDESLSEETAEYVDGLGRASIKLKNLMEDLIDFSKTGSGKIDLDITDINIVELMRQLTGDWQDKFDNKGFSLMCNFPEEAVLVKADGKSAARIVDNLLANIYKYAMEGTRVYIDIIKINGEASDESEMVEICIKNISKDVVYRSEEELLMRFSKGEESRTDDGHGLGLAIAKNLVELMKGQFKLKIDGDLFKVIFTLPVSNNKVSDNEESEEGEEN